VAVPSMEVRWSVVEEEHLNRDAIKVGDGRHRVR
jgi:hypothetical protein